MKPSNQLILLIYKRIPFILVIFQAIKLLMKPNALLYNLVQSDLSTHSSLLKRKLLRHYQTICEDEASRNFFFYGFAEFAPNVNYSYQYCTRAP